MIFKSSEQAENESQTTRSYKKGLTPSHILISKDLTSKEYQVFEAAVYYLCTIASFKKEYQADIIDILNKTISANKKHPERIAYIEKMMQEKKLV